MSVIIVQQNTVSGLDCARTVMSLALFRKNQLKDLSKIWSEDSYTCGPSTVVFTLLDFSLNGNTFLENIARNNTNDEVIVTLTWASDFHDLTKILFTLNGLLSSDIISVVDEGLRMVPPDDTGSQ